MSNDKLALSHSGRARYETCAREYYLHYVEKLRPTGNPSALLFGGAIDVACEHYMLNKDKPAAYDTFKNTWSTQEKNGIIVHIADNQEIEYRPHDFDHELLSKSDNEFITEGTVYETPSALVKAGEDKERIAYCNWISLFRKGNILLARFIQWVDENVEEVLEAQAEILLEDEDGNTVPGKADFVIKIYGYDKPILIDLKTSAMYYDRNSVKESEQLALYYLYLKNTKYPDMERAAYLVLSKQIKKNRVKTCRVCGTVTHGREKLCAAGGKGKSRCNGEFDEEIFPECSIQYIHDEIPEEFIQQTVDKFNIAVVNIKEKKFEPCWEACSRYNGKILCPYFEFCRSGSMEGLIKKASKEETELKEQQELEFIKLKLTMENMND